jgi:hypothetical protein
MPRQDSNLRPRLRRAEDDQPLTLALTWENVPGCSEAAGSGARMGRDDGENMWFAVTFGQWS